MKNKGRSFVAIILMGFVVFSSLMLVSAESEITIQLNNTQMGFPDAKPSTALLDEKDSQGFSVRGITIGTSEEELIAKLGQPARKDLSKYGFQWYIYNQDYANYVQVGVLDGVVVGLYSNTDHWLYKDNIKIGTSRKEVEKLLGESLKSIKKGNTIYHLYNTEEKGLYLIDGSYVSFYYDLHGGNTVTSVHIIREDIELGLDGFYGKYSEGLRAGFERQIFDLANVVRVRNGLAPFQWSDKARDSARKHSRDMAYNNFFEHVNLKGEGPAARMEREGINYRLAAENIAAGTSDAIEAHEGWMNSLGHRQNILGKAKNLGVGVDYNASSMYQYYYTQNFFTEM